jgi:phosphatidylglycerophosphate synthase
LFQSEGSDVTSTTVFSIVRGMGVARLLVGCFLPLCGWNGWWGVATFLFIAAFLTDMIDGAMARHWEVATSMGARLDSRADIALTGGGLLAVSFAGLWHAWVSLLLLTAFAGIRWLKPKLRGERRGFEHLNPAVRGELLGWVIVLEPAVNLLLTGLLVATLLAQASDMTFAYSLLLVGVAAAAVAYGKRRRIRDCYYCALEESEAIKHGPLRDD